MLLARLKAPLVSSDAAPPTVRLPLPSAPALPSSKPPALRLTPPPNRFAPPSVTTPVLVTVRPPAPDNTPLKLKGLVPPNVSLPVLSAKEFASVSPPADAAMAPPLTLKVPVPNDAALLKLTKPSLIVALVPVQAPCRFQVPLLTVRFSNPV
ncbi:hypothetical protein D3C81_1641900 [compost metagenome]